MRKQEIFAFLALTLSSCVNPPSRETISFHEKSLERGREIQDLWEKWSDGKMSYEEYGRKLDKLEDY